MTAAPVFLATAQPVAHAEYRSVFSQATIFVKKDATGAGDGSSWADAYTDLHQALQAAEYGDQVWVAADTFYPTADGDRSKRFELKNGVKLYGGFSGWETELFQRDWESNKTVLSGDIGQPGDSTDNSYNILFMMDVDSTTRVDGLYFTGGQADLASDVIASAGAAMHIDGSQGGFAYPKIHNCTFEYNVAFTGGAVAVNGTMEGSVAPQFYNCTFRFNKAYGTDGGAVARYGGSWEEMPGDFWNCTFYRNESNRDGGAVYYKDTERTDTLEFTECRFEKNTSIRFGGALALIAGRLNGNSYVVIQNSKFYENIADTTIYASNGGALYLESDLHKSLDYLLFKDNHLEGNMSTLTILHVLSLTPNPVVNRVYDFCNLKLIGNRADHSLFSLGFDEQGCVFVHNVQIVENTIGSYFSFAGNYWGDNPLSYKVDKITAENNKSIYVGYFINIPSADSEWSNIFSKNEAQYICRYCYYNVHVTNMTVVNQKAHIFKVGDVNQNVVLDNAIFLNSDFESFKHAEIRNSLIYPGTCDSLSPSISCGPNNLFNVDPMFLDTAAGDFRLHPCSAARDAGDNTHVDSLGLTTDLAGMPRIQGGVVDMGAYESPGFSIHTDSLVVPPCQGSAGTLWLELDTGCPPFFIIANGTDTIVSDTSRLQLWLPAGHHTLVVSDGRMDSDTLQISMPDALPLEATLSSTDVLCPGSGGTATISPQGGTGPYTYHWSSGDTSATASGLAAGVYSVTLTDSLGCTLTDSVEVGASGHLTLSISIQPISCHDSGDGVAAISPLDGTGPYSWLWNDGRTDSLRTDLSGGQYSVTVSDALGCTDELSFFLPAPDSLVATATASGLSCAGSNSGSATATATGGTAPYSYFWSNSSTYQTITNLSPGWYSVTVSDIKGCQDTASVLVQSSPALSLSIAGATVVCPGDSTVLAAQAGGGTAPYSYQWNTGSQDSIIVAGKGSYKVTLTDANGCTQVASQVVSEAPPIELLAQVHPVTNANQPNGAVEVQLTFGGTPPYSYQWSHGPTTASVDGLSAGQYTLTVSDALGCTGTFTFEVLLTATRNSTASSLQALIVPNPSGSAGAVLHLRGPWPQRLRLSLHDGAGRFIWQQEVLRSEEIVLPKESLPPGTYWLVLRSEEGKVLQGLKWSRW